MIKRGFTLLEVSVASFLGLLLLTILISALIPLMQSSRAALQRMELSQICYAIRQRLVEDLQKSPTRAINYPSPSALSHFSIQPVEKVGPTGSAAFANSLIVYEVNLTVGKLSRKECQPAGLAVDYPNSYTELELNSHFTQSTKPARLLASGLLKSFQLASLTPQQTELKRLQIVLQNGPLTYSWDETVALRNENL